MELTLSINYQLFAGWMETTIVDWANTGINVCAVNWGTLSREFFNYFVVSEISTVRVANYLVEVLLELEKEGINITETTLAGHSLGAQISGKVGAILKKYNKTLGKIYGK